MKNAYAQRFATLALIAVAPLAVACDEQMRDEQLRISEAGLSLQDAVRAAESHHDGKAVDASLDDDRVDRVFEVTVVADGKVFEVDVNGTDGSILRSREDRNEEEDVRLQAEAKISLIEAIDIAEREQGGKAFEADLDDDHHRNLAYEVSTSKDQRVWDVLVDADDGRVLGTSEDLDD